ncbi:MAG: TIGR02453 family protein [Parasphingorhabdus sp.]
MIAPALFDFLRDLKENNNREWFKSQKTRYETEVVDPVTEFIENMAPRVGKISSHIVVDPRPNGGSRFRIYRDTRFSKDKSPYKTQVGCQFRHEAGKDAHAPGFYVHLSPGEVFFGGGVWGPKGDALRSIRQRIVDKPEAWKKATRGLDLRGDQLVRAPKGFDPEHPLLEDLRRKSFFSFHDTDEDLVTSDGFEKAVEKQFKKVAPLMEFVANSLGLPF